MIDLSKGVVIIAIGKPVYQHFAVQLACSIKYWAKKGQKPKIQLIHDGAKEIQRPEYRQFFDVFTHIKFEDSHLDGVLEPGLAKTCMYKYLEFDESIYLDADGIACGDVRRLFKMCTGKDYVTQPDSIHWIDDKQQLRDKYGLDDSELYGSNSSFQYIKKGEACETLFAEAEKAIRNPFPLRDSKMQWFGKHPDELYMTVGVNKAGINPYVKDLAPVYFQNRTNTGYHAYQRCKVEHGKYILGMYATKGYLEPSVPKLYDIMAKLSFSSFPGFSKAPYSALTLMNLKH